VAELAGGERSAEADELPIGLETSGTAGPVGFAGGAPPSGAAATGAGGEASTAGRGDSWGALPVGSTGAGGVGGDWQSRQSGFATLERADEGASLFGPRSVVWGPVAVSDSQPAARLVGRAGLQCGGLAAGGSGSLDWLERGRPPAASGEGGGQQPVFDFAAGGSTASGLEGIGIGDAAAGVGLATALWL